MFSELFDRAPYIRIRGQSRRKLVYFLNELMYFYWKISYFGHFVYTDQGQPGGQDFIRGGRPPPWPHVGYGPDSLMSRQIQIIIVSFVPVYLTRNSSIRNFAWLRRYWRSTCFLQYWPTSLKTRWEYKSDCRIIMLFRQGCVFLNFRRFYTF